MSLIGTLGYAGHLFDLHRDQADQTSAYVTNIGPSQDVDVDALWTGFYASLTFITSLYFLEFGTLTSIRRYYDTDDDSVLTRSGGGGLWARGGDDVINVFAENNTGQHHVYSGEGNDTVNMDFSNITVAYSHGHHVRGDSDGSNDRGADIFNFAGFDDIANGAVVVGRIDDLDMARDAIHINGNAIDLYDLPTNVHVVEYNGDHNDPDTDPQQWLLIETALGGHIFYTLEGARIDMGGAAGHANGGTQEGHFVEVDNIDFADLIANHSVRFIDQVNTVPPGYAPDGGVVINDADTVAQEVWDPINGSEFGDLIAAGLNDDLVLSGDGNDYVWGGSGSDVLHGGAGHDLLRGGTGHDQIYGDADNDTLAGNEGNDTIEGGAGNDDLYGGADDDLLLGRANQDTLRGCEGDDRLFGGAHDDVLAGNAGNDTLEGGSNDDRLFGGSDNDILIGGAGRDILNGGTGADVFVFTQISDSSHGSNRDTIEDFEHGIDRIDLNIIMPGLTFVETYTGTAGQVRYNGVIGRLYIDTDGNGASDFSVDINGAPILDAGDLILV